MASVDLSNMNEQELNEYKRKLNDELYDISKREKEIEDEKRRIEKEKNDELLEILREHKDIVLKILPKNHDRKSCSDEHIANAYMEGGYPRCTRCMLLDILDNEYINEYKIIFDVKIREI